VVRERGRRDQQDERADERAEQTRPHRNLPESTLLCRANLLEFRANGYRRGANDTGRKMAVRPS
jgi:hypothetical protein